MSRLECKVLKRESDYAVSYIRICPDWNVKYIEKNLSIFFMLIRICPDWNVKVNEVTAATFMKALEYVQIGM